MYVDVNEAASLMGNLQKLLKQLKLGNLKAYGRDIGDTYEMRKAYCEIPAICWEDYEPFNGASSSLFSKDDHVGFCSIRLMKEDVLKAVDDHIATPQLGGRNKILDAEKLFTQIAAYLTRQGVEPPIGKKNLKAWREELQANLPYLHDIEDHYSDRTLNRTLATFLDHYNEANERMDEDDKKKKD